MVVCGLYIPDVLSDIILNIPFYSFKERPRLQGVGVRVGLDRGMVLTLNISTGVTMGYYAYCTVLLCTFLQS